MKLHECNCGALLKAIDAYIAKEDDNMADQLAAAGYAAPKSTVQSISALEDELVSILESDTKYIVGRINDYDDLKDFINEQWPDIQNSSTVVEKLTRTFDSTMQEVIPEYVSEYLQRTDADLSALSLTHQTTNWITTWFDQLAHIMKLDDNQIIQNILDKALRDGTSCSDVADQIADSGIRDPGFRARRVSVTEILRAHSVAQQESFDQSPAVTAKMWRHSGWRPGARQNHIDMDGQTVAKDDPFILYAEEGGVFNPMYPRDSILPPGESVNCGCISEPIVSEDVLGLSLEERKQLQQSAIDELDEDFDKQLDEQNKQLALQGE